MNLILSPPSITPPPSRHSICTVRSQSSPNQNPIPTVRSPSLPPPPSAPTPPSAIIIGGGLSGLSAAVHLHSSSVPFILLESSDDIGGRVRTDIVDGFLLDRGFQIFITAYPHARRLLDYQSLSLNTFYSGALVYCPDRRFHPVSDPFRHLPDSLSGLFNPVGTLSDKLLVGLTRLRSLLTSDDDILTAEEVPVLDLLRRSGFSESMIDRFFRPFFGGIFFDSDLETTSRLFNFIFKCLASGDNVVPSEGIAAIPRQLAGRLPAGSVRLNSRVESIEVDPFGPPVVRLEGGDAFEAELGLILAVEEFEAERLLKIPSRVGKERRPARGTVCVYFAADRAPVSDPVLILNGSGRGIVNNMCFMTNIAPSYGPPGKVLVSVTVVGAREGTSDEDLTAQIVGELSGWFGEGEVREWRHLRTYRIGFAQPDQSPPTDLTGRDPRVGSRVYVCGDYWSSATFDGALVSGTRAAEALVDDRVLLKDLKSL
ncbi:hypothetical protein QJS04_geneDACA000694 [Acorus gramineus]|uniref:Amine oxidase domain-containing protein n=1 Tax=Acorus gramineus TaxID=55184 RepID=A0AAV9ATG5_ACOGR|nr:hypothetical protein QJS04_geneDACA000694 [Acorus gramineus]